MLLIGSLCAVWALGAATERSVINKASGWSQFESGRRYAIQKPTQVNYDPLELDRFLFAIMDKLEDMPLPDDPKYAFVRDEHKQLHACEIPEDDDEAMEFSANPDDVMETVLRSFPDGKCAGRIFGEWYYEVCGNMEVKRSPFTVAYMRGKPKVTTFKAYESLGVLGRDRKVSRHLDSITEPRYVQQSYYDGAKCNLGGQPRRMQSVVTFECSRRFVDGYVHISEAVEEHPCKYRLLVQSADFCENKWLYGLVEENSVVSCRIYLHPERIKPLLSFLDKYRDETREYYGGGYGGVEVEQQRNSRILDYVMSELTWASLNPDVPYTEEERRSREEEEEAGREEDQEHLMNWKNTLNKRRSQLKAELEEEDDEEEHDSVRMSTSAKERYNKYYDSMGFTDLLQTIRFHGFRINFYIAWLDYIRERGMGEYRALVRPWLIPPNRNKALDGAFVLLEPLIKSKRADLMRRLYEGLKEEDKKPKKPLILYDGEIDESDLEEIARKFMQVYKAAKAGGSDTLLFELLDDEDFEY